MEFVLDGITAFLIVRDEERLLPGCLDSLVGVVDALVVVDTGSTDRTLDLLEAARERFTDVTIRSRRFEGYGPTRQAGLDLARTPWALWIDADERLSPGLREELLALNDDGSWDALSIPFRNHVLGRVMKCRQLTGQSSVRLFRTGAACIDGAQIHERVVGYRLDRLGCLQAPIDHLTLTNWREYLGKVDRYTTLEAAQDTQRFRLWHLLATGPATFLQQYIRRTAIRDGWPGFVWAAMSSWSAVLRDIKLMRRSG